MPVAGKGWMTLKKLSVEELAHRVLMASNGDGVLASKLASIVWWNYGDLFSKENPLVALVRSYRKDREPCHKAVKAGLLAMGCSSSYAKKRSTIPKIKGRLR
jgi:hypothetical protein